MARASLSDPAQPPGFAPPRSAAPLEELWDEQRFRRGFEHLLKLSLEVFHHYAGLEGLSRQLGFLSFNAGFASFRAGDSGRTVNVLTQFTREMSGNLKVLFERIVQQRSATYRGAAAVISALQKTTIYENARSNVHLSCGQNAAEEAQGKDAAECCAGMKSIIHEVASRQREKMLTHVDELLRGVQALESLGHSIADLVQQVDSIAVLMSIEAGSVKEFSEEFHWVADNIRKHVDKLAGMVRAANRSCSRALKSGRQLTSSSSGAERI
jgi:hypothetical protein